MKNIILALPYGFSASTSYSLFEILSVSTLVKNPSSLSVRFLTPEKEMLSYLETKHIFPTIQPGRMDVLVLLGSAGTSVEEIFNHLQASEKWAVGLIKKAKASGAIIASSCSGAYFLAKAGLLKNKKATTAWWITPEMVKLFPETSWVPEEILSCNGKVITSGGSMSALELSAELMARFATTLTQSQTEKMLVIPNKRKNQKLYKVSSVIDNPQMQKALRYIKENISTCSLDELLAHMSMSQRTFHRFCMKHVKLSPYQWIMELRLEKAQKLLDQTQLSIQEIAFEIGYENLSSFQKSFKKSYGVTPDKYRKSPT